MTWLVIEVDGGGRGCRVASAHETKIDARRRARTQYGGPTLLADDGLVVDAGDLCVHLLEVPGIKPGW